MIPAVYNANMRITQSAGYVAITYELIHDTRIIPIESPCVGTSAAVAEDPHVHGQRARPLGRDDARRGDDQPQGGQPRVVAGPPADGAVHAHEPRCDAVSGDLHRSGDVDGAVDGRARHGVATATMPACSSTRATKAIYGMSNMLSAARAMERRTAR